MDPLVIFLAFAALGCGIGIGINYARHRTEAVINNTIIYMIKENYVNAQKDENGEWELLPLKN